MIETQFFIRTKISNSSNANNIVQLNRTISIMVSGRKSSFVSDSKLRKLPTRSVKKQKQQPNSIILCPDSNSTVLDGDTSLKTLKSQNRKKSDVKIDGDYCPDSISDSEYPKDLIEDLGFDNTEFKGNKSIESKDKVKEALERPSPINSDYLPLPWKGRLGYACLNTYLRTSTPPVFISRTCRIASIIEHCHPLKDPNQPEHPTKNRPDKNQPKNEKLGKKWVEELCLANIKDISKMIRWNDKYGIKFMRLSSEMFPFASHKQYGYKLSPFASEALKAAGKVIAELGHRVSVHPGQFTQLGSPRKEVIENSFRDLEYHDEMLTLLKLPKQLNKDAVMILHMGGMFGSKDETLNRFRENYSKLSPSIKRRLVLENDDMCWSVHDLLPICQELNIPLVLDFHHHNIIFDSTKIREGTKDIIDIFPIIKETWTRKGITQKMHYSESCDGAITQMQRRKHRPRVITLPPCVQDMDLMIEAKDKEQAVFDLMKTFKIDGYDRIGDIVPHVRQDENPKSKPIRKRSSKKIKKNNDDQETNDEEEQEEQIFRIPDEEVGMGGPERRVYWPLGQEDWLKPKKREQKVKEDNQIADTDGVDESESKKTLSTSKPTSTAKSKSKSIPKSLKHEANTDIIDNNSTPKPKSKSNSKSTAELKIKNKLDSINEVLPIKVINLPKADKKRKSQPAISTDTQSPTLSLKRRRIKRQS